MEKKERKVNTYS